MEAQLQQLNRSSTRKFFLAYRDVDWDAAEHTIDPEDPRLCLRPDSPLGGSAWYQALPEQQRARLGLDMLTQTLKFGIVFESTLSSGLLEFTRSLPNRSAEYRYAMHELVEESQHSMMFQEFINRSGMEPVGASSLEAFWLRRIARCGQTFPELFFFFVLAGEIFIDHDNRQSLRLAAEAVHPLVRRMMQIHVTEEARHVRFAQLLLGERVPKLSRARKRFIRLVLPYVMRDAQRMMLEPTARIAKRHRIPREVLVAGFGPGSGHRARVEAIAEPVFALLGDGAASVWPK